MCRLMKDRELEAKVIRFVREIGITPEGKVRTVGFDLTRGVVVINTDEATYAALPQACGLTTRTTWRGSGPGMPR